MKKRNKTIKTKELIKREMYVFVTEGTLCMVFEPSQVRILNESFERGDEDPLATLDAANNEMLEPLKRKALLAKATVENPVASPSAKERAMKKLVAIVSHLQSFRLRLNSDRPAKEAAASFVARNPGVNTFVLTSSESEIEVQVVYVTEDLDDSIPEAFKWAN